MNSPSQCRSRANRQDRFVLNPLTSACLLALATLATPARAQEVIAADAGKLEQVVVTGTRASLQQSLELKRNAAVVQDSISATELGRFPDNNVADSLSHITGVSISRTAGGEGQRVSIRGLGPDYTLTTFNGRCWAATPPCPRARCAPFSP